MKILLGYSLLTRKRQPSILFPRAIESNFTAIWGQANFVILLPVR